MPTAEFNMSAVARAKTELALFQSNVIVQTRNGSEIRGVWEGCRFVDFEMGDPITDVVDFWADERFPVGGLVCQP